MKGRFTKAAVRALDGAARALGRENPERDPAHLVRGRRGEDEAYFYLREHGYVMVARNWRSRRHRGEIDLIGWDGDVLCFIEVKTRAKADAKEPGQAAQRRTAELPTAEAAVDESKRRELAAVARDYAAKLRPRPTLRFDIVSVYSGQTGAAEITLFKNAFPMP